MSLASFWLLSMLSKNNLHKVLIMFELLPGRLEVSNKIENKIKIEKRKMKQHGEFQKREFFVKK